jgi:hypothetical protein
MSGKVRKLYYLDASRRGSRCQRSAHRTPLPVGVHNQRQAGRSRSSRPSMRISTRAGVTPTPTASLTAFIICLPSFLSGPGMRRLTRRASRAGRHRATAGLPTKARCCSRRTTCGSRVVPAASSRPTSAAEGVARPLLMGRVAAAVESCVLKQTERRRARAGHDSAAFPIRVVPVIDRTTVSRV